MPILVDKTAGVSFNLASIIFIYFGFAITLSSSVKLCKLNATKFPLLKLISLLEGFINIENLHILPLPQFIK